MKMKLFPCILGLCMLSCGCNLAQNARRNVVYEISFRADTVWSCYRDRRTANAAWNHFLRANPGQHFSGDYASGFNDGFADYLDFGGTCAPPPLPPQRYWSSHYQTRQNHQALDDWYAGFQHGAAEARASGYRELIAVGCPPAGPDGVPAQQHLIVPPPDATEPFELLPPANKESHGSSK